MDRRFSIYLDAVRFLAAMAVFASHLVYTRWTGGLFPSRIADWAFHSGTDAVMVFFVLSGFVIAYTVDVKDRRWNDYAFSRATRIYSVALPALVLTFLLDRMGAAMNPSDYSGWWYADHSFISYMFRGLTFSNEFWTWEFRLGTNGPYWSLGYEVWFYVLFGLFIFTKGWLRALLFGAVFVLVGPRVWILAPVWIMGAALYQIVRRGWLARLTGRTVVIAAAIGAIASLLCYAVMRVSPANEFLESASAGLLSSAPVGDMGFSSEFLWSWSVGLLICVHFASVAIVIENLSKGAFEVPQKVAASIRWLAGASFSIYLVHYPVLQALDAVLIGDTADPLRGFILMAGTLASCFVFAALFERPLSSIRRMVKGFGGVILQPRRVPHQSASPGPKPRPNMVAGE